MRTLVSPLVADGAIPIQQTIDRIDEARRLVELIPAAERSTKSELFDRLAELAQSQPPQIGPEGRLDRGVVVPEVAHILLQALQSEQLVEHALLGPRYQLRGPENEVARREIAQRTYASVHDALGLFRGQSSVKSYVLGIVANHYRAWVREMARNRTLSDLPDDDRLAGASFRSSLLLNKVEIARAMTDLAPRHRQILQLAFFDGLPAAEIQARLDLTSGQYRNRRRQALKEMAELLEERGHAG